MTGVTPQLFGLDDVIQLHRQKISAENAHLLVFESGSLDSGLIPFRIARVFMVCSESSIERGKHMHKQCSQVMFCIQGKTTVRYSDGRDWRVLELDSNTAGAFVPPTIWAEQIYEKDSKLLVFCDRDYEADDYIRNFDQFKAFRNVELESP
jgi:dTDP-4-dehydrorhamnose 3,5-epimerase-like enzyme